MNNCKKCSAVEIYLDLLGKKYGQLLELHIFILSCQETKDRVFVKTFNFFSSTVPLS